MSHKSDCEKNLLQREIRKALGTSISMNTTLELIGSVHHQREKSEALVVLEPDREPEFLAPLSVGRLWGVGRVTGGGTPRTGADAMDAAFAS